MSVHPRNLVDRRATLNPSVASRWPIHINVPCSQRYGARRQLMFTPSGFWRCAAAMWLAHPLSNRPSAARRSGTTNRKENPVENVIGHILQGEVRWAGGAGSSPSSRKNRRTLLIFVDTGRRDSTQPARRWRFRCFRRDVPVDGSYTAAESSIS